MVVYCQLQNTVVRFATLKVKTLFTPTTHPSLTTGGHETPSRKYTVLTSTDVLSCLYVQKHQATFSFLSEVIHPTTV